MTAARPPAAKVDAAVERAGRLAQEGHLEQASILLRTALRQHPRHAGALHAMGLVALQSGRRREAIERFRAAITTAPGQFMSLVHLGVALCLEGRWDEGLAAYAEAERIEPGNPANLRNWGQALLQMERAAEAVPVLLRLVEAAPWDPAAQLALGNALMGVEDLEAAKARFFQAAALEPANPAPWSNLGTALLRQQRPDLAAHAFDQALRRAPDDARLHNNRGAALVELARARDAEAAFRQALARDPVLLDAHIKLADVLARTGRSGEAADQYAQAWRLAPDNVTALDGQVWHKRRLARWQNLEALTEKLTAGGRGAPPGPPAVSPLRGLHLGLPEMVQRQVAAAHAAKFPKVRLPPPRPAGDPARRPLRIGYLSADFRDHAMGHLLAGLFSRHDRAAVHVTGYSIGPIDDSPWRRRIEAGMDVFRDLTPLRDDAAAAVIRQDGIGVLIDLQGYTEHARLGILARRPAPVQATWLGYPGTLASPAIDYLIADTITVPESSTPAFAETVIHLPHCYQATDRDQPIAPPPRRAEIGLPEAAFVFCCFNGTHKIHPFMFDVWIAILRAVPDGVLWLYRDEDEAEPNLRREAAARGIAPERLFFAGREAKDRHLARLGLADLFLDTLPYCAHTTASDALWAGLPLLTCQGDTFQSRVAASILTNAGLPDLITTTLTDYQTLAIRLATTEREFLAALRRHLAETRLTCPLFDADRLARDLETAFADMWQRHCHRPAS